MLTGNQDEPVAHLRVGELLCNHLKPESSAFTAVDFKST